MATEPSPRPWRANGHSIEANDPDGLWLQNEKTGWGVVANLPSCPKSRMSKRNRETWDAIVEANAALIVAAVNEREHLRDLVKRLADALAPIVGVFESDIACGDENKWKGGIDQVWAGHDPRALLREARAAIGEGETPTGKGVER